MASIRKMNLTQGVIPIQIIKFMTPLAITFVTQILFHTTDVIVVGRFAKNAEHAVAAIGSSGPVTSILMTIFLSNPKIQKGRIPNGCLMQNGKNRHSVRLLPKDSVRRNHS